MILMLHPFKVGDFISAADGSGTVDSIGLVYTTIMTVDNQKIVIPNSKLSSSTLTNTSAMETRRLILTVPISYNADIKKAKDIVKGILEKYPAIINEEGILVVVDSLGDSAVNLSVRGWVKNSDYWQAKWDLTEEIKLAFDEQGIEIPYQHVVVQMKTKE
jgi:small conductance mechanosensitive channel